MISFLNLSDGSWQSTELKLAGWAPRWLSGEDAPAKQAARV